MTPPAASAAIPAAIPAASPPAVPRAVVLGLIGFLTLVDLFAAQAILPTLVETYGVSRAAMGFAVNASTIGMAAASLLVALIARRVDRRRGVWMSLALLSVPTALLAFAPDLTSFTTLRIAQGVLMASAFTLMMAYIAERAGPAEAAAGLAAYVTGIVASNLVGRLVSGSVAEVAGLAATFWVFAGLNLLGAALVAASLRPALKMVPICRPLQHPLAAWAMHLASPALRAAFGIGFLILFVFIGVFTYVNFELSRPPLALSPMHLGLVYLVFLPAMLTTPFAGRVAGRIGPRRAIGGAMLLCVVALVPLLSDQLALVLAGLAVVGVATFFAQAGAAGFVSRSAASDRAAASGLYLAAYYLGGLAGAAVLGQIYDGFGWRATVAGVGLAALAAAFLATRLRTNERERGPGDDGADRPLAAASVSPPLASEQPATPPLAGRRAAARSRDHSAPERGDPGRDLQGLSRSIGGRRSAGLDVPQGQSRPSLPRSVESCSASVLTRLARSARSASVRWS